VIEYPAPNALSVEPLIARDVVSHEDQIKGSRIVKIMRGTK